MRPITLVAAVVAIACALATMGFAVSTFNSHQGLPSHISVGTQWGHVVAGEPDTVAGRAVDAKLDTKLLLDAQEVRGRRPKWHVIATTSRLRPGGSFEFVVRPRVKTRYKVLTAVDHQNESRVVAVIVDSTEPSQKHG
jgi:hypothetical protein